MKSGRVRFLAAAFSPPKRKRIFFLLPLFIAGVAIPFLIQFSTYPTLNYYDTRQDTAKVKEKHNEHGWQESNEGLEEQMENETVIIDLELWKQPTLLNLNFTWIASGESICELNKHDLKDLRLMPVLIHTARSNFDERLTIRRTWGSVQVYKNWHIRLVFLMGQPNLPLEEYENEEKRLQNEQSQYGDLVIGSFVDSYHNLTYKHLMGYKWALNFCSNATFVLKMDDDIFINIMKWLDWRSDDLKKVAKAKIPNLYCQIYRGAKPIRELGSKWYVSVEDWPAPDYPDYCSGWAYGITMEFMKKIYVTSNDRKIFWVDDVFVTGALLELAKERFNLKPEYKTLAGQVAMNISEYRPFCENRTFENEKVFNTVEFVLRGKNFKRDMECMWNKTLYDHYHFDHRKQKYI